MNSEITQVHQFVQDISSQGGAKNKDLLHYKCVPKVIVMFNSMIAFKNVTESDKIVIPSAKIDNASHKISFEFSGNDITDVKHFTDCVKRHCKSSTPVIRENSKANSITVKI